MGCRGSKHELHGGGGAAARAPEPRRRRCSAGLAARHTVALRSSTLGTLSLDRATAVARVALDADEGMMKDGIGADGGVRKYDGPSRSFHGWRPTTPPVAAPPKRQRRRAAVPAAKVAPRTPNKTPARAPEEINVWELMKGLEDEEEEDGGGGDQEEVVGNNDAAWEQAERKARSAPGSPPVFDPEILDTFRKALDELPPAPPPRDVVVKRDGGGAEKGEIQTFPGIVRARVSVLQEKINSKNKLTKKAPPESAGRVVVYLTSLRGIRETYEDCWSTSAVLRGYGVLVDERDLSMHAGFKDELRAALGAAHGSSLPQVFADGRHLGGAEEVRRMHEAGELAAALEACDLAPAGKGGAALEACGSCGGMRFVPCDACSGSCKVFVEDEDGAGAGAGAFRRCPGCNENGLVKCPVC